MSARVGSTVRKAQANRLRVRLERSATRLVCATTPTARTARLARLAKNIEIRESLIYNFGIFAGYYCDSLEQTEPTGLCDAGYFCVIGSTVSNPTECPMGFYCPVGTHIPFRCPNATWSNNTHLTDWTECTECPAGWYCQSSGLTQPQDLCQQGYYCPVGSNVPNPVVCPIGLHCPEGSDLPEACPSGYFTNTTGRNVCMLQCICH